MRSGCRAVASLSVVAMGEEFQQCPDGQAGLCRVTEGAIQVEGVASTAPETFPAEIAGLLEVRDDALGGAFGDVAGRGDVTDACGRAAVDGQEHASVVSEESPPSGLLVHDDPPLLRHRHGWNTGRKLPETCFVHCRRGNRVRGEDGVSDSEKPGLGRSDGDEMDAGQTAAAIADSAIGVRDGLLTGFRVTRMSSA